MMCVGVCTCEGTKALQRLREIIAKIQKCDFVNTGQNVHLISLGVLTCLR